MKRDFFRTQSKKNFCFSIAQKIVQLLKIERVTERENARSNFKRKIEHKQTISCIFIKNNSLSLSVYNDGILLNMENSDDNSSTKHSCIHILKEIKLGQQKYQFNHIFMK
jgi:hypothetical protein